MTFEQAPVTFYGLHDIEMVVLCFNMFGLCQINLLTFVLEQQTSCKSINSFM